MSVLQDHPAKTMLKDMSEKLADPPAEYSIIPFWFWNDALDEEKIRSQLVEMLVKKIKAFCIHPMPDAFRKEDFIAGMPEEYLGDRFMECVRFAAHQAQEMGMKVWLYDEGGWPSGLALGRVVQANPDFSQKMLHLDPATGDLSVISNPARTDILNPAVTQTFIEITYERYRTAVGDFFGDTITGIFTDEPNIAGRVGSLDVPWTEGLVEYFKSVKGYDLMPLVRGLFKNPGSAMNEEQVKKIRYDFCDVVSLLFTQSYFKPIRSWCSRHNIKLVGHLDRDHTITEHLSGGYSLPRLLQYYDIPGVDCIWRQIFPDKPGIDFPKFAGSVAHTRGRRFVLSESFGAYGLGLSFSQMKTLVDHQYVRGVNLLVPHAFHYSCQGPRAFGVNSNLFLSDPRWSYFKDFAQYVSRLSFLMSQGKSSADVGLYYPIAGLWKEGLYSDFSKSIALEFDELSNSLMENQVEFDYLDEDAVLSSQMHLQDGCCSIGEGRYSCLIVPNGSIGRPELLDIFDAFVSGGGTLIVRRNSFSGTLLNAEKTSHRLLNSVERLIDPHQKNGIVKSYGCGKIILADTLKDIFINESPMPRSISLTPQMKCLKVCRRSLDCGTLFFIVNESRQEQRTTVNFKCPGKPMMVNIETGIFRPMNAAAPGFYELTLPEYGACAIVVFADGPEMTPNQSEPPRCPKTRLYPVQWSCRVLRQYVFREGNMVSIPLDYGLSEKTGATPWLSDFQDTFSGTMEYCGTIALGSPTNDKRTVFHFGGSKQDRMFRLWINDKYVGARLWPPFELEIGNYLIAGENSIRVTVSNTLGNLMKSESVINDLKRLGWFNVYMKKLSRLSDD